MKSLTDRQKAVRDWAIEQVRLGYASRSIAQSLGGICDGSTIIGWAKRAGVEPGWPYPMSNDSLRAAIAAGRARLGAPVAPREIFEFAQRSRPGGKRRRRICREDVVRTIEMVDRGERREAVAASLGVSAATITRILQGRYDHLLEQSEEQKPTPNAEPAPVEKRSTVSTASEATGEDTPPAPATEGEAPRAALATPPGCVKVSKLKGAAAVLRDGWEVPDVTELLGLDETASAAVDEIVRIARGGAA